MKKLLILLCTILFLFSWVLYSQSYAVEAKDDFTSPWFKINVADFTPGKNTFLQGDESLWTKWIVNILLWTVIQNLMIAMGILSLLTMTIWAGHMIAHHGSEDLLGKGKSIFTSWLIALVVALSSYYIIALVRYLLYSQS